MKKSLVILSAVALLLACVGCSSDNTATSGGAVDKAKEIEQQTKDAGGEAQSRE
ncbi:MAG: hypothetical protein ABL962_16965 [Fimbriimonadaceae bacterium]